MRTIQTVVVGWLFLAVTLPAFAEGELRGLPRSKSERRYPKAKAESAELPDWRVRTRADYGIRREQKRFEGPPPALRTAPEILKEAVRGGKLNVEDTFELRRSFALDESWEPQHLTDIARLAANLPKGELRNNAMSRITKILEDSNKIDQRLLAVTLVYVGSIENDLQRFRWVVTSAASKIESTEAAFVMDSISTDEFYSFQREVIAEGVEPYRKHFRSKQQELNRLFGFREVPYYVHEILLNNLEIASVPGLVRAITQESLSVEAQDLVTHSLVQSLTPDSSDTRSTSFEKHRLLVEIESHLYSWWETNPKKRDVAELALNRIRKKRDKNATLTTIPSSRELLLSMGNLEMDRFPKPRFAYGSFYIKQSRFEPKGGCQIHYWLGYSKSLKNGSEELYSGAISMERVNDVLADKECRPTYGYDVCVDVHKDNNWKDQKLATRCRPLVIVGKPSIYGRDSVLKLPLIGEGTGDVRIQFTTKEN